MPSYLLGALRPEPDLRRRANARCEAAATYYLVTSAARLAADTRQRLAELLAAEPAKRIAPGALVVSRPGLSGSWARSVEQIVVACSLAKAGQLAIERGRLYQADTAPPHDPLLQDVLASPSVAAWSRHARSVGAPRQGTTADMEAATAGTSALAAHLADLFAELGRAPTPAEAALLAQLNSDHCSHATFKASWPKQRDRRPLLTRLEATCAASPAGVLAAYRDNAAVIATRPGAARQLLLKAETHNHPTALAPFEGAATGVGGEIRDETATGRGGMPLAGFAGYIVSSLEDAGRGGARSGRDVALDAPLGASAYANEFGRPQVAGFFRNYVAAAGTGYGFAKPVMLVGGVGLIRSANVQKLRPRPGDRIVVLGGAGARVGIGGASASSGALGAAGGAGSAAGSVQRGFAEMQRRAQEVINACAEAATNPLIRLHDVGAGGIGGAIVEMLAFGSDEGAGRGALGGAISLERIPADQRGMDATEILINEAQERYVAVVAAADLPRLARLARREGCPLAAIGTVGSDGMIVARHAGKVVVELPLEGMLAPAGKLEAAAAPPRHGPEAASARNLDLATAWPRVLAHPAVADKSFLTTIADRGVGGLVARDQHVGPRQLPVADCAVMRLAPEGRRGCAVALGERAPLAAIEPTVAARGAVAEALTNLASAPVGPLRRQKLALNWMADGASAAGRAELVRAVDGVCAGFLQELGLAVVAGKDSVAMRTELGGGASEAAPAMCVASAVGQLADVAQASTPQLSSRRDTVLMHLPVNGGRGLAGSVLAQCFDLDGADVPDVSAAELDAWWRTVMALHKAKLLLAYHDVSDGGLIATVTEMALCANRGVTLVLDALCAGADRGDADGFETSSNALAAGGMADVVAALGCETPGAVFEVRSADAAKVLSIAAKAKAAVPPQTIGRPAAGRRLRLYRNAEVIYESPLEELFARWSELGHQLRAERDDPECARQARSRPFGAGAGLHASPHVVPRRARPRAKPAAVVLRGPGCNGHAEMAAALAQAGLAPRVVAMAELAEGVVKLAPEGLLVLPGGFGHGDALGAGTGQARTILHNRRLRRVFAAFFAAPGTLALGVCNGCQVLAQLGELLPAPCALPRFCANRSLRFEARLAMVEVLASPSPLLAPLGGVRLPVPVACGEGRAIAPEPTALAPAVPALRFVGPDGLAATSYPDDPCGGDGAICGYASCDGKLTLLMPHPERAVLATQLSWCPPAWRERGKTAWHDMFVNARNHLVAG